MEEIPPYGQLEKTAARAWFALVAAAAASGWQLTYTGRIYRSYERQEALFRERYVPTFNPLKCSTTGSRTWNGKRWWRLRGKAPAATPGTSNHGLGLAVDVALGDHPSRAKPIGPAMDWMVAFAPQFGFSWELQSEPWHIRYVAGDKIPRAVLDYEHGMRVAPRPVPQEEETYKRLTVRRGMRQSEAVKEMQQRLTDYGIRTYVDGWFGSKTETSVRRFQAENKLAIDGICGPRTWRKLIEATS
ncbi:MAG: D-alanyl-D-alanine carboxypeptidase family protein [Ilumatobacteraceae bacterium]